MSISVQVFESLTASISAKDAEIARLRAELVAAKAERNEEIASLKRSFEAARNAMHDERRARWAAETDLSSARAALDKDREALSAEMGHADLLAFALDKSSATRREVAEAHRDRRARRAAEARASACPLVCCGCDDPKQHETGSAAEAKEPTCDS